jgi:hypothetical protein
VNKPQYKYLDRVNSPAELKELKVSELADYCAELRDYIVRACAENPGHLSSSLGAVELTDELQSVIGGDDHFLVWRVLHIISAPCNALKLIGTVAEDVLDAVDPAASGEIFLCEVVENAHRNDKKYGEHTKRYPKWHKITPYDRL